MADANWGQGAQGAAGGAMTGAAMGTAILPGWGTAIGAGVGAIGGGLMGLFGGGGGPRYDEALRARLMELERQYQVRQAPQGVAQQAGTSAFRGNQQQLVSQLTAMGRGEGPSAAQLMMREGQDRVVGGQASLAAGAVGSGVNAGAALRGAANNAAALQSQNNRDTGLARVNEQIGALNQLGLTLHGARTADEQQMRFNTSQLNEMELANIQARLQQLGINDRAQLQALLGVPGSMTGQTPGTGSAILAGGASVYPAMMQMRGAGQSAPGAPGAATQAGNAAVAPQQQMAAPPMSWSFNPTPGYAPQQSGGPQPWDPNTPVPRVF